MIENWFVEVERMEDFQKLQKALNEAFGGEVEAERVLKKEQFKASNTALGRMWFEEP